MKNVHESSKMPLPVLFEIAILSILFLRLSMQLDTKEVQTFTKLHFAFNIFTISTKIWLVSFNIRVRILLYIREKCFFFMIQLTICTQ